MLRTTRTEIICVQLHTYSCLHYALSNRQPIKKRGYGPIAIVDWSIIVQMSYIGQTWVLASIGAVVEMGVLSTLKRPLMEYNALGMLGCCHYRLPWIPHRPAGNKPTLVVQLSISTIRQYMWSSVHVYAYRGRAGGLKPMHTGCIQERGVWKSGFLCVRTKWMAPNVGVL
jgi:hypothetical protein